MLVECIALEASGFLHAPPSSLTPAVGESLHLCAHELYTLQAFRKNKVRVSYFDKNIVILIYCCLLIFLGRNGTEVLRFHEYGVHSDWISEE